MTREDAFTTLVNGGAIRAFSFLNGKHFTIKPKKWLEFWCFFGIIPDGRVRPVGGYAYKSPEDLKLWLQDLTDLSAA
jgi:hypothetical protein